MLILRNYGIGVMLFCVSLFLILIPAYSQSCRAKSYPNINQCYNCQTTQRSYIWNSDLPSGFNGAKQVTFGFWMKNVLVMTCVQGWQVVFKAFYDENDNMARWPSIYHRIVNGQPIFYFGASLSSYSNSTEQVVPIVYNGWYYIVVTTDFTVSNYLFRYYIYDPSAVATQLTEGVTWSSYLIINSPTQYSYSSSYSLVFGSDKPSHYWASICVSFPSVIVGTVLSSYIDITMMAYSLFNQVSLSMDFFGTPVMRRFMNYDTNTDMLDTTSSFSYSYDFGTTDGTAQTNLSRVWTVPNVYQTLQLNSPTQTLVLSPNRNYSFIDSWGFMSFGARIVFKMTSMTYSSSCNYHWLFRRVQSGTGTVKFGLGVKSDGAVIVNVGGLLGTSPSTGIVTENTWITLKIGCFSRGFTNKILCLILDSDGLSQARQEIWINYVTHPYTNDANTDKLLFGGSACGASTIYFFSTNFGFVPEVMDQCQWGCSQNLPSSNYCALVGHWSNTCTHSPSFKSKSRLECLKCPRGCATCTITDYSTMNVACVTCSTGLTLNSNGICACPYGQYYNMAASTCQTQTIVYAYLALAPDTQYQFDVTFSSAIQDLQMITSIIQATIINGDYTGNQPTITFINTQYLQINFSPSNPIEDGTTLWVSGLTDYNKLPYNPYFIKPETLSYVFGLTPLYKTDTVAIKPAPIIPPLEYGPRYPTYIMSSLNILFGLLGSSAMVSIKVLSDITMYKFINVGFPQNFLNFSASYIGNGFIIPNPFQNVESNSTLVPISPTGQFQPWVLSTVYLANAGTVLTKEIICGGMIVLTWIVYLFSNITLKFKDHMRKAIYIFQWNISLCFLFGDFPELMLYSLIHIQEGSNSTTYQRMSIAAYVIMLTIYGCFFAYTFYLLNVKQSKAESNAKKADSNKNVHNATTTNKTEALDDVYSQQSPKKMQKRGTAITSRHSKAEQTEKSSIPPGMKIITEGIYQDTVISRNFILILQMQNLFIALVIGLIQVSGIVQALFYILLNSALLIYLPIARPFKSRLLYVLLGGNCGGHLILGVIAALLGSNDRYPTMSSTAKDAIGIIMIGIEMVMLAGSFIIAGVTIVQTLMRFFRKKKVSDTQIEKLEKEKNIAAGDGGDTSRNKLMENDELGFKRRKRLDS